MPDLRDSICGRDNECHKQDFPIDDNPKKCLGISDLLFIKFCNTHALCSALISVLWNTTSAPLNLTFLYRFQRLLTIASILFRPTSSIPIFTSNWMLRQGTQWRHLSTIFILRKFPPSCSDLLSLCLSIYVLYTSKNYVKFFEVLNSKVDHIFSHSPFVEISVLDLNGRH